MQGAKALLPVIEHVYVLNLAWGSLDSAHKPRQQHSWTIAVAAVRWRFDGCDDGVCSGRDDDDDDDDDDDAADDDDDEEEDRELLAWGLWPQLDDDEADAFATWGGAGFDCGFGCRCDDGLLARRPADIQRDAMSEWTS